MASHDSSSSPPPLHPHHHHHHHHHQQQPPLHHHYHHHPQQQQQTSQTILMAPPQQFEITSYPINPYQHHQQQPLLNQPLYHFNQVVTDGGGAGEESSSPPPADGVGFNIESTKRKRGRPRKNPIDGEGNYRVDLGVSPDHGTPVRSSKIPAVRDLSGGGGTQTSEKRRGRPPGSVKKQIDSLGSPGTGFTPHVMIVNAGEDVASKVVQFMQQGSRTMYVMSANGSASHCTLQIPGTDFPMTYEGNYEIVSLTGSSMLSDSPNGLIRVGGLSVLLAGPDCRVIGGVAESLIANAEVKVIIGSFIVQDVKKPKLTATASQASIASDADVVQLSFGGDHAGYGGDHAGYGGDHAGYGGDQVTVGASQQSGGGACSYDNSDGENNNSEANNGGGGGCYDNSGQQQQMQKIPISLPMYGDWGSSAKVVETTFPDVF